MKEINKNCEQLIKSLNNRPLISKMEFFTKVGNG